MIGINDEDDNDEDLVDDIDDLGEVEGGDLVIGEVAKEIPPLIQYVDNMPTFSPATKKITELAQDINASPNEIVKAIRMDPLLTGKVLQLVNSAYFSLAEKVTSLNRAVVYLGINTIKNLALSTAIMQTFSPKSKELARLVAPMWRHSLATAVCCKSIAKILNVKKDLIEEFFIAGLLHDLGRIVLMQCFFGKVAHDGHMPLHAEKRRFQMSHDELVSYILEKWHFSDELVKALGSHHNPEEGNLIANTVHLADVMTYKLDLNNYEDESPKASTEEGEEEEEKVEDFFDPPEFIDGIWDRMNLTDKQVLEGFKTVKQEIQKATIFLKIGTAE